jgi:hypothetical protein
MAILAEKLFYEKGNVITELDLSDDIKSVGRNYLETNERGVTGYAKLVSPQSKEASDLMIEKNGVLYSVAKRIIETTTLQVRFAFDDWGYVGISTTPNGASGITELTRNSGNWGDGTWSGIFTLDSDIERYYLLAFSQDSGGWPSGVLPRAGGLSNEGYMFELSKSINLPTDAKHWWSQWDGGKSGSPRYSNGLYTAYNTYISTPIIRMT